MLLDGRLLEAAAELLDVGRDVQRFDECELVQAVCLAPGEEADNGPVVGGARVRVADGGGEKLEAPARCPLTGAGDDGRDYGTDSVRLQGRGGQCRRGEDELAHSASQGLMIGTPQPFRSRSRVATAAPCARAIEAIMASNGWMGSPARRRPPVIAA